MRGSFDDHVRKKCLVMHDDEIVFNRLHVKIDLAHAGVSTHYPCAFWHQLRSVIMGKRQIVLTLADLLI